MKTREEIRQATHILIEEMETKGILDRIPRTEEGIKTYFENLKKEEIELGAD